MIIVWSLLRRTVKTLRSQISFLFPFVRNIITFHQGFFFISVLTLNVFCINQLFGGITRAFNLQLGTKTVYLFGDHHKAGKEVELDKQVDNFLEAVEETSSYRNTPLHVLVEKGRYPNSYKHMLYGLEPEVHNKKLTGITVEDAEIRKTSITAHDILTDLYPFIEVDESTKVFENGPLVVSLTFNDIIESYNFWLSYAENFRVQHVHSNKELDEKLFRTFDQVISHAKFYFYCFEEHMKKRNIGPSTNIGKYALKYYNNHKTFDSLLSETNDEIFFHLFDVYLFIRIYNHQSDHIAVVAGGLHACPVLSMLRDIGAVKKIDWQINSHNRHYSDIRLMSKYELSGTLKGAFLTHSLYNVFLITFIYTTAYVSRFLSFFNPNKLTPTAIVSH